MLDPLETADTAEDNRLSSPPGVHAFLIADVRGYTHFTVQHGDEAAARLAARFAAIARDVVTAHGGEVIELRGDEALAVFDSSRQALPAAVAFQARLAEEAVHEPALRVGIGLDAGEAIPVEGGFRGAALNLAARLCSLAGPSEILASDTMIALARKLDGIAYRERGLVPLKGFDDPIRVMEVTAVDTPPAAEPETAPQLEQLPIGGYLGSLPANPLVGREGELRRAIGLVETVQNGTGKLLLLLGEPGAGKTRLAQEITLQLRNRDFVIAAGRSYEPQQSVPFYPFVEALTALYEAAPAALQKQVPSRWAELARLLPALGLPVSEGNAAQDEQRLYWAVTGFVDAIADDVPVAIMLDDLHWADAASLELLQHLARHTAGSSVLLLATYRDVEVNRGHPLETALRDLRREDLVDQIEVRRLGRDGTAGLIAALMDQDVSEEFSDLVYRRTEGNPFFVQQVLRVLVERGDVYRNEGVWDRKSIEEIEVPESVRSVVGHRLSRLAEETQEILREASVLGQAFTFDELQNMSGRDEHAIEGALDESMGAGLIRESGRDTYNFDHALTQGAVYAELSSRRRRRLHLAAGEAIEALPERKRAGRAAELAWHFLEADDPERALTWSVIAGDDAERVYAHSDAEWHYRTALQLSGEVDKPAMSQDIREKLSSVLKHLARLDEARELLETAAETYQADGDFEGEMRTGAAIGAILFEQGRREEGIERLQPVADRWEREATASRGAALIFVALANLHWHAGRTEEALALAERAAALAAAIGDDRTLGLAEARRGVLLLSLGRHENAEVILTRAIEALERAGDLETVCAALNNRALSYGSRRMLRESLADLMRGAEVARQLGDPIRIAWATGHLGHRLLDVEGDWEAARSLATETLQLRRLIVGSRSSQLVARALTVLYETGDLERYQELEGVVADAEQRGDAGLWAEGQILLAGWCLLGDKPEQARDRARAVVEHPAIEEQFRPWANRVLADAYLTLNQLDRAEAIIDPGLSLARSRTDLMLPNWLRLLARLRTAQKRYEEAQAALDEALTLVGTPPAATFHGQIMYQYGEILRAIGDDAGARRCLREALATFERMHTIPYIERTRRTLASLESAPNPEARIV